MPEIDPRILLAEMLITLGVATYQQVKAYFSQNSDDDAALAAILSEVDARLARRSSPQADGAGT